MTVNALRFARIVHERNPYFVRLSGLYRRIQGVFQTFQLWEKNEKVVRDKSLPQRSRGLRCSVSGPHKLPDCQPKAQDRDS